MTQNVDKHVTQEPLTSLLQCVLSYIIMVIIIGVLTMHASQTVGCIKVHTHIFSKRSTWCNCHIYLYVCMPNNKVWFFFSNASSQNRHLCHAPYITYNSGYLPSTCASKIHTGNRISDAETLRHDVVKLCTEVLVYKYITCKEAPQSAHLSTTTRQCMLNGQLRNKI